MEYLNLAQSLDGTVPLVIVSKKTESAVLWHAGLSLYNILIHKTSWSASLIGSSISFFRYGSPYVGHTDKTVESVVDEKEKRPKSDASSDPPIETDEDGKNERKST